MPASFVRFAAGRLETDVGLQAMAFFAGANSILVGDTLLTADNPGEDKDGQLFAKLGLSALELGSEASSDQEPVNSAGRQDAHQS